MKETVLISLEKYKRLEKLEEMFKLDVSIKELQEEKKELENAIKNNMVREVYSYIDPYPCLPECIKTYQTENKIINDMVNARINKIKRSVSYELHGKSIKDIRKWKQSSTCYDADIEALLEVKE